jgi:hypothetical protein
LSLRNQIWLYFRIADNPPTNLEIAKMARLGTVILSVAKNLQLLLTSSSRHYFQIADNTPTNQEVAKWPAHAMSF